VNEYLHIGKHLWSYGILMQYLCNMHIGFVVALFFYFWAFRAKSTLLYRDGEISKRFERRARWIRVGENFLARSASTTKKVGTYTARRLGLNPNLHGA